MPQTAPAAGPRRGRSRDPRGQARRRRAAAPAREACAPAAHSPPRTPARPRLSCQRVGGRRGQRRRPLSLCWWSEYLGEARGPPRRQGRAQDGRGGRGGARLPAPRRGAGPAHARSARRGAGGWLPRAKLAETGGARGCALAGVAPRQESARTPSALQLEPRV